MNFVISKNLKPHLFFLLFSYYLYSEMPSSDLANRIEYSDKYSDDQFEYRYLKLIFNLIDM